MAKPVKLGKGKEFNFTASSAKSTSKYPWDQWLNGDLLMLEKSTLNADGTIAEAKDYDVDTDAMPPKIKTASRKRYKVCQISRVDADGNNLGDAIIIKARPMTDEEKQAEDLKRAEEKEARKSAGDASTKGESDEQKQAA